MSADELEQSLEKQWWVMFTGPEGDELARFVYAVDEESARAASFVDEADITKVMEVPE